MGDFNSTIENKRFEELLNLLQLNTLISSLSCFQSTYPACIDLILTNQGELFSNSNTCEVETSDHQNLVSAIRKKKLTGSTKSLFYRDCKKS